MQLQLGSVCGPVGGGLLSPHSNTARQLRAGPGLKVKESDLDRLKCTEGQKTEKQKQGDERAKNSLRQGEGGKGVGGEVTDADRHRFRSDRRS